MNLRQKVKRAKQELKILNEKSFSSLSQWEIVERVEHMHKLESIINYKAKPSRVYRWNEEHKIDWDKLTYIEVQAEFETLAILKSPNGKVLSKTKIKEFLDEVFATKLRQYAQKVSEIKLQKENKFQSKYVDYCFSVSNDRTKSKKKHIEKVYFQKKGEDRLYAYEKSRDSDE